MGGYSPWGGGGVKGGPDERLPQMLPEKLRRAAPGEFGGFAVVHGLALLAPAPRIHRRQVELGVAMLQEVL